MLVAPLAALACAAFAGDWSEQDIDPKARPSGTAYTIGRYDWKLGLVEQDFGLFENAQIGTVAALWALSVPNGRAKVDAIRTKRLDIAIDGAIFTRSLADLGVPGGNVTVTPIGFTASGVITRHLGLHGGFGWTIARADGRLTSAAIADGIEAAIGADVRRELEGALGEGGGLYAGANLTLYQTRLSADWRFNRRDSLVLTSNTYVWLAGLVAAGVGADVGPGTGTEVEVGASARIRVPLAESIPSLTTLSWQWSWRRTHLRVGVPLPLGNTFAWLQAFDLYVILGPSRKALPPKPP